MRLTQARAAIVVTCALPAWAVADPEPIWVRQFGSNKNDYASAVARDGAGCWVSGRTAGGIDGPNAGSTDAFMARYDSDGHLAWIDQFGTEKDEDALEVMPDGVGGSYVAGYTGSSLGGPFQGGLWDAFLARYDADGNRLWLVQFGTTKLDQASGLAPDGAGGVIVTGYTDGAIGGPNAGGNDIFLARYNADGGQVWAVQIGSPEDEWNPEVVADGVGGVYLTCSTEGDLGDVNQGLGDAFVSRFDSEGSLLWSAQLGTPADDLSPRPGLAADGGVLVTGVTEGDLGAENQGGYDAFVAHYGADGTLEWLKQFGTNHDDYARGVVPDGDNAVVGGYTYGILTQSDVWWEGDADIFLARFDAAGEMTWLDQVAVYGDEIARGLDSDGRGGWYVVGSTDYFFGGDAGNLGLIDAFVTRINEPEPFTAGEWATQFGTWYDDLGAALATDGSGGAFVAGHVSGGAQGQKDWDGYLRRLDSSGNVLWTATFAASKYDLAFAAAPDGSGGAYVSAYTEGKLGQQAFGGADPFLARYDGAGQRAWIIQFGSLGTQERVNAAASDGSGGVYVAGETDGNLGGPSAGSHDAFLGRFDSAGNKLWLVQFGTVKPDFGDAVAPDGSGGVYAAGETQGSLGGANAGQSDAFLARYDGEGNQLWMVQLGSSRLDYANGLAEGQEGRVYVAGHTLGDLGGVNAGEFDAYVACYDPNGQQLWIKQFGTDTYDSVYAAAPDGEGGVYVGGDSLGDLAWEGPGGYDPFVVRFDAAGNQVSELGFGTGMHDSVRGIIGDDPHRLIVSGYTRGSLGGPTAGLGDAVVASFSKPAPPCAPDCDGSGDLTLFDFLCFVNLFNAGDPAADCAADGVMDLFDFLCFVNGFNEGC